MVDAVLFCIHCHPSLFLRHQMCEPIPFVRVVDGSYVVTTEAEKCWSSVKEEGAIVVVVGRYRTGQSFLMSRCLLADEAGGVNVGSAEQSRAEGVWL